MKKTMLVAMVVLTVMLLSGCGLFSQKRPLVGNAGYVIQNDAESKATVVIGSNNTQANAIHSAVGGAGAEGGADADQTGKAKAGGLFVNNTVGNRSADVDATTSLEKLSRVQDSTVGQTTGRDQSPATSTATPTTSREKNVSVSVPVSASQNGTATSAGTQSGTSAGTQGGAAQQQP